MKSSTIQELLMECSNLVTAFCISIDTVDALHISFQKVNKEAKSSLYLIIRLINDLYPSQNGFWQ